MATIVVIAYLLILILYFLWYFEFIRSSTKWLLYFTTYELFFLLLYIFLYFFLFYHFLLYSSSENYFCPFMLQGHSTICRNRTLYTSNNEINFQNNHILVRVYCFILLQLRLYSFFHDSWITWIGVNFTTRSHLHIAFKGPILRYFASKLNNIQWDMISIKVPRINYL